MRKGKGQKYKLMILEMITKINAKSRMCKFLHVTVKDFVTELPV